MVVVQASGYQASHIVLLGHSRDNQKVSNMANVLDGLWAHRSRLAAGGVMPVPQRPRAAAACCVNPGCVAADPHVSPCALPLAQHITTEEKKALIRKTFYKTFVSRVGGPAFAFVLPCVPTATQLAIYTSLLEDACLPPRVRQCFAGVQVVAVSCVHQLMHDAMLCCVVQVLGAATLGKLSSELRAVAHHTLVAQCKDLPVLPGELGSRT